MPIIEGEKGDSDNVVLADIGAHFLTGVTSVSLTKY